MSIFAILKIVLAEACILTGACVLEPGGLRAVGDCNQLSAPKARVQRTRVRGTKKHKPAPPAETTEQP